VSKKDHRVGRKRSAAGRPIGGGPLLESSKETHRKPLHSDTLKKSSVSLRGGGLSSIREREIVCDPARKNSWGGRERGEWNTQHSITSFLLISEKDPKSDKKTKQTPLQQGQQQTTPQGQRGVALPKGKGGGNLTMHQRSKKCRRNDNKKKQDKPVKNWGKTTGMRMRGTEPKASSKQPPNKALKLSLSLYYKELSGRRGNIGM